ncbi:MAG: metal-dependent hydrolase [Methanophagales archaeon]|nr:metal-dependent hydrolase [Methanophagales archaeon]
MFVFGHIGVTLGIAFVISRLVLPRIREGIRPKLNYLFIALGAILPDLIDKPIGRILLGESVANGRLFGHTLLFVLILITIGYFSKYHRDGVFCLSFATFMHLCEDRMWEMPATLLYPLYGFDFPKGTVIGENWYDYFLLIFNGSYVPALSYVFVSEIMGIVILGGLSGFAICKAFFSRFDYLTPNHR